MPLHSFPFWETLARIVLYHPGFTGTYQEVSRNRSSFLASGRLFDHTFCMKQFLKMTLIQRHFMRNSAIERMSSST
jgi:hypothetical protein